MAKRTRTSALAARFGTKRATVAIWDEVDPELVARLVRSVSHARCAVLFGHTRDGGALALTFFDDSEKYNEYHPIDDHLEQWMEELCEWWEQYAEEKKAPKPAEGP